MSRKSSFRFCILVDADRKLTTTIQQFSLQRYSSLQDYGFNGDLAPVHAKKNVTSCPGLINHYAYLGRPSHESILYE